MAKTESPPLAQRTACGPPPRRLLQEIPAESSGSISKVPPSSSSSSTHHTTTAADGIGFISVYPSLPPNAPKDHPHIINTAFPVVFSVQHELGFADVVATILYKYDLAALDSLLDLHKRKFDFRHASPTGRTKTLFVERRIKFVTAGFMSANGKTIEESITYRIIDSATGPWEAMNIRGPMVHSIIGRARIEEYVRKDFARRILRERAWDKGDGAKFVVNAK